MVEPGRVASGGMVQLVARVRNSAEEFDGRRIRGAGRGECGSNKFVAGGFDISGVLVPFCRYRLRVHFVLVDFEILRVQA